MDDIIINGYISFTKIGESGKHLICVLKDESQPEDRFYLLESKDATVPTGTEIVEGVFSYAKNAEGETIEPEMHESSDGSGTLLNYHIGYLVDAKEIKNEQKLLLMYNEYIIFCEEECTGRALSLTQGLDRFTVSQRVLSALNDKSQTSVNALRGLFLLK